MRTSGKRTFGAWTDGCEVTTNGWDEKPALQALAYGYPKEYSGSISRDGFFFLLENLSQTTGPKKPREQNATSGRRVQKDEDKTCHERWYKER